MPSEFIVPPDVYSSFETGNNGDIADVAAPLVKWKGWIKSIAIIQIASSVLYILALFFIVFRGIGAFGIGIVVALLPIYLSVLMLQIVSCAEQAHRRGDACALKLVLDKAKTFLLVQAIVTTACFLFASIFTLLTANFVLAAHALRHLAH